MKRRFKTISRSVAIVAAVLGCPRVIDAQIQFPNPPEIMYGHDPSGNLTTSSYWQGISAHTRSNGTIVGMGNRIVLNAFAAGNGPFTYQWLFNGGYIWDATNATYLNAGATALDSGSYGVIVSGSTGSVTNQIGNISVLASTNSLFGIAYGLGQYVAVGEAGTIVRSADLITWSIQTSGTSNQLESVAFGGPNVFVAVGTNGTILRSFNGVDWYSNNAGNTNQLRGVTYGNTTFVAVGGSGTTLTSPDGATWTTRTFDYPRLEAVAFGGNNFVAVGSGGTIWTSNDGINWFDRSFPTNLTLNGITYGNGRFVAVGERGLVLTSSDTTNWSFQASGTIQAFEAALSFNNCFYAVGPGGKNFLSTNSTNWNKSDAGTFDLLFGMTVGNNIPVAVGRNGTIIRIPVSNVDHFEWNPLSSPQLVNQSFSTTIAAKDAANNSLGGFSGSVTLSALSTRNAATNQILGDLAYSGVLNIWPRVYGNVFTPSADLLVTHVRHFFGKQISIWTDNGQLLARIDVTSSPGVWLATPLSAPLVLYSGRRYVVSAYTEDVGFYRSDTSRRFANGTIDQAVSETTNVFPRIPEAVFWYLVDLIYIVQTNQTLTVSPGSATLSSGAANVNVSLSTAAEGVVLMATDSSGRSGISNPFNIYATNDLAVTIATTPSPVAVQSNLTSTIIVLNAGPSSSTGVTVTNSLPANVSFISANPNQGSCSFAGGVISCSLGTLASGSTGIVSVVTKPTVAGAMLTNTVKVARNEAESNLANNAATALVYVPPVLAVGANKSYYEGNVGLGLGVADITLSSPSILAVTFTASSANGTAVNGTDYTMLNQSFTILPGVTNAAIPFVVHGDTVIESNETLFIKISNPTNATLGANQITVTLVNDDGESNKVHYFAWNTISSPQRTNQPLSITVTARDVSNNVATTFATNILIWGINIGGVSSRTALTNEAHTSSEDMGVFSLGYEFTPSTNIFITHLRRYFGTKVSLWNSGGSLLVSTNFAGVAGEWSEAELTVPVFLSGGSRYRISAYSGGDWWFWRNDGAPTFGHGTLNQGYYANNDAFPTLSDPAKWTMVDFRYSVPGAIAPTNSPNFASGTWTGSINIQELGTNFTLMANDRDGHIGFANRFGVYQTNDLAVTVTNSTATVLVGSNLTLFVRVLNSGPTSSTGVFLTNTLSSEVTNVSVVTSQGTCTITNGSVICNLGVIGDRASSTVTISMTPLIVGLPITNTVMIVRNESDPNPGNNQATIVVTASADLSALLRTGADYTHSAWRSSGNALWLMQTNTTYDGVDALQSGAITHGEQSWVETTVRGPGILSFRWKVSSQAGGDNLKFLANGFFQTNITGEVNWTLRSYNIPPGPWNLRWQYLKDASISSGSDAAWLDQVVYTVPPFYFNALSATNTLTNTQFRVTLNSTNGQRLFIQASSDLIQWTTFGTVTMGGSTTNLLITSTNSTYRFYRAQHRND